MLMRPQLLANPLPSGLFQKIGVSAGRQDGDGFGFGREVAQFLRHPAGAEGIEFRADDDFRHGNLADFGGVIEAVAGQETDGDAKHDVGSVGDTGEGIDEHKRTAVRMSNGEFGGQGRAQRFAPKEDIFGRDALGLQPSQSAFSTGVASLLRGLTGGFAIAGWVEEQNGGA